VNSKKAKSYSTARGGKKVEAGHPVIFSDSKMRESGRHPTAI